MFGFPATYSTEVLMSVLCWLWRVNHFITPSTHTHYCCMLYDYSAQVQCRWRDTQLENLRCNKCTCSALNRFSWCCRSFCDRSAKVRRVWHIFRNSWWLVSAGVDHRRSRSCVRRNFPDKSQHRIRLEPNLWCHRTASTNLPPEWLISETNTNTRQTFCVYEHRRHDTHPNYWSFALVCGSISPAMRTWAFYLKRRLRLLARKCFDVTNRAHKVQPIILTNFESFFDEHSWIDSEENEGKFI